MDNPSRNGEDRSAGRAATPRWTYGGETTCTEIIHGPTRVYADMGSGFRRAGEAALRRGETEHHVWLSHLHWDHIMGLPLFGPLHETGHNLHIHHVHADAPRHLSLLFNGVNFPLRWAEVEARVVFHQVEPGRAEAIGDLRVTAYRLDHPGDAYGFRFETRETGGPAVAVAVDSEVVRRSEAELGPDAGLYREADLLLIDAQYDSEQLRGRRGWGHGSPARGIELAERFGVRELRLTHHDPSADDAALDERWRHIRSNELGPDSSLRVGMAWDGWTWSAATP